MTKQQAVKLAESKFWEDMSFEEIAKFQLFTKLLCMPFSVFHNAMEKTLKRSIFTHEFGLNLDGIKKELLGEKQAPTIEELIAMIPKEKRIIVLKKGEK